jgi:hypothetical protein
VDFEREALPWIDDVYRFALSLTRDESDADDVVQARERLPPLAVHHLPQRIPTFARTSATDGRAGCD